MRGRSKVQAVWVVALLLVGLAALAMVIYDPVMDAIFIDRDGIGTELAP
jgi:hypothetical protein